ncbi:MAG: DUF547 domain-containing protein [Candidatus Omnitrophota bacterium]|jgi:hypothetical protein
MTFQKKILASVFFLLCSFPAGLYAATAFDHSAWDAFLKKNVNENGEVDYQSITRDPKDLNDYLASLMAVSESKMASWPREEVLAFWMNAYHVVLIKQVAENYPVTSVQKIPSFWDITLFRFGKKAGNQRRYSLNDIRLKKLIEVYHDEKIHLALSAAAKGGPKLMPEAFTGPKVEGQLFLLTRKFVMDPAHVDVTPGRKKIRISKIFKWYGKDFRLDFGTPEPRGKFSESDNAVLSFLAYYLEDEAKEEYLQEAKYKIEYPAFDWTLNDWKKEAA